MTSIFYELYAKSRNDITFIIYNRRVKRFFPSPKALITFIDKM